MGKNPFENVIAEFAPSREFRSTSFPIRDGDIFTGTFHHHSIMYDGMIEALSRAIGCLRKEEQAIA